MQTIFMNWNDKFILEDLLDTVEINRLLSRKGCPYDNAVIDVTFKSFKKEFVYHYVFNDLGYLKR